MRPPETIPAAEPGALIADKYRVERIVGRGGMGIVVAARHVDLNQEVAIKVLLPSAAADPDTCTRFLREGRAAARLTSRHVAKVYDTGRLPSGEPYLVMEFLQGRDLKALVKPTTPLPLANAVGWVLEAAEAIGEAHALGIVHRDIKPANLFLADTTSGSHVKVLDFGVSKQLDTGDDLTTTATCVGTPRYMAPEQMRSAKHADARADIWALGAVLYELTTGKPPFGGQSITEIVVSVMQTEPTPPSTLNPALPSAFDAVVLRCLQKDAADRFPTVEAFAEALRSVVSGGEIPASRPSLPDAVKQAASPALLPESVLSATPVSAALTPPPGAIGGPTETMKSWNTGERPSAQLPARSKRTPYFVGAGVVALGVLGAIYGISRAGSRAPEVASRSGDLPSVTAAIGSPATAPMVTTSNPEPSVTAAASSAPATASPHATVAPTVPPKATPQAAQPAPKPPPPAAPPAAPAANCSPPFTVDAQGMKHAKPECL